MRRISIIFLTLFLINSNMFAGRGSRGGGRSGGQTASHGGGRSSGHSEGGHGGGRSSGHSEGGHGGGRLSGHSEGGHGGGRSSNLSDTSKASIAPIAASATVAPTAILSPTSTLTPIDQTLISAVLIAKDSITKNSAITALMNSLTDSIDIGLPNRYGLTILDIFKNDEVIRPMIFQLADAHLQNAILSDNAAEAISSLEICAVFSDADIKKSKINVQQILTSTKAFIQNVNWQNEDEINKLLSNNLTVVNGCHEKRKTALSYASNNVDSEKHGYRHHASAPAHRRLKRARRIVSNLNRHGCKEYSF